MTPSSLDARVLYLCWLHQQIGRLYAWGGDGDEWGVDCSGLVCDGLTWTSTMVAGAYDGQRRTAQGLLDYYEGDRVEDPYPGCLLFWRGSSGRVFHVKTLLATVGMAQAHDTFGDRTVTVPVGPIAIDAGGGGSATTSPRAALLAGAGVRLSSGDSHSGQRFSVAVDPFKRLQNGG